MEKIGELPTEKPKSMVVLNIYPETFYMAYSNDMDIGQVYVYLLAALEAVSAEISGAESNRGSLH